MNLRIMWPLMCVAFPLAMTATAAGETLRPNVVLLVADDLGYGELGCQGNPEIPTPHIDSLAARGIRMTNGYVTASYCSASRAGLLTGRYQTRFGYEFNPIGAENEDPRAGLPPTETTLAEHLHQAGYATALIGKWHLGGHARYHPLHHGFDEFFGFTHEGHFYVPPPYAGATSWLRRRALPEGGQGRWVSPDGRRILSTHLRSDEPAYDANNPIRRQSQPVDERDHLTDAFTREAVSFIERHRSQPFFLYVAYNAVHSPMQATDAYLKRFEHIDDIQRRIFAGMLSQLDDSVGAILRKLNEARLTERTLIFFLSDNGGPTRELTSSNLPLRGGKGQLYEGGIRVPVLVQWAGRLPSGKVYQQPVISLDIFATAAAAAEAPLPTDRHVDGVDLLPYLMADNTGSPHQMLFWRMNQQAAIRAGDWKLVRRPGGRGVSPWELYHLAEDVEESADLAIRDPERVSRLGAAWEQWNSEMVSPLWQPNR